MFNHMFINIGANWFLAGGGRRMVEEEATAAAAERIAAAAEDGTSLPVRLATDVVRFLYGGTGRREPADGGVVSAPLLNAKPAVGGIGVEPRWGGVLRVLFTVASDAVADTVVRWRHELRRCVDSTAVFDVLSDREKAQHQALWPAFLAAKVAGKRRSSTARASSLTASGHPFLIGVAGGTASGKTTVCDLIMQRLNDQCVVMLSQDSFYRSLTPSELVSAHNKEYNFDAPEAFDQEAMMQCLMDLKAGNSVNVPLYDFATHSRCTESTHVAPADVVIVEGILVLHMESIRELLHMKVYVDTDDDVRLARRIQRDVAVRGRDVGGVIEQYTRFVKPSFDRFVAPSRRYADVIIPWQRMENVVAIDLITGQENVVAIDLITEHIKLKLKQHDLLRIYPNLAVIPSNFQIRGMHTIIRDRTTKKNDFVFYANRMCRIVVEAGLGMLPFKEKTVQTPAGEPYTGVVFTRGICGVSVIRSGEAMENALRECCQGIKIGKVLVHRHSTTSSQQELIYEKLPCDIASRQVLLLDPVLGTGNTACNVIRVLLQHGVKEAHILFLCIVAAPEGIHKVCREHPGVRIVTSEIDRGINSESVVVPGVGEFGDRYFSE
ncbi:hypothetical protein FOA52_004263 [Chlamydomonas sp. UWO 241]|nr:hypothetical protein FOA52_004263 [Chlamydomonas sp. UWO 241]